MCTPHPPHGGATSMHTTVISNESVRACIGALQHNVKDPAESEECFKYLRTVADHFHSENPGNKSQ